MRTLLIRIDKHRLLTGPALLLALAMCGAGYGSSALAKAKTHTVVIEAMQFSPQALEINRGDTVIWVNKDAFPHNASATDSSFQSKEIASNGSWKFKSVKKGSFPYTCTLHPTMKGSLIVK